MNLKTTAVIAVFFLLTGCWNGGNNHVRLGDVSIGAQLIDLKTALAQNAITPEEYEQTKRMLLTLNTACQTTEDED